VGQDHVAGAKKNAKKRRAWLVFQDESGISQKPPVRRTWAPKGETPVLVHGFNWKRMSISAALCYRWDFGRSRLYFQTQPGSYNAPTLIAFLEELKRHFRGDQVSLVWDGLPAHRSRLMSEHIESQRDWLTVTRLPGYAPELNPVEILWGNVKGQELANLCPENLADAEIALREGLNRVRRSRGLAFSFLRHTGLFF
jgi:transposase